MTTSTLYPMKFNPLFQYRIWGGRNLAHLFSQNLPGEDPIGEAWVLSDRKDHPSRVKDGFLTGKTIAELMKNYPKELMGKAHGRFDRFPLLLKFLDAQTVLSVQVHPSDNMEEYLPPGESGKSEAWVVLETNDQSKIYAGLPSGTTKPYLEKAIKEKTLANLLPSFHPSVGDAVYIPSGSVHTIDSVVVFEVQENSDVTYRLYDWDRVDEKTNKPRELQVEKALACIDFNQNPIQPVVPQIEINQGIKREKLFDNEHFEMWRIQSKSPFKVGKEDLPRILVGIEGYGKLKFGGNHFSISKGEVVLIPAVSGIGILEPMEKETIIFEIGLPTIH